MTPDMLIARYSEVDGDGFIGVQVDNYGAKAEFGTVEAHHPFGFISCPRDPDVDGEGNVKLGCTVLRLAEGNESHVIVLGDPRYTGLLPAATKKKGGSTQYAVTADGAVSYAALDGDDGSYKLHTPNAHVDISDPSGSAVVGNVSGAQNVMLAPDLLSWIAQVNAYMAQINFILLAGLTVTGTANPGGLAVTGVAAAGPPSLPTAVPIASLVLKASQQP